MENPRPMRGTLRFGVFEADTEAGELRKQGRKVRLQEQPFQILLALLEKPNEVITREELQKKVWPAGTFIDFEHGVNNAIRKLREALGDSSENPRFIETLSRRGYRFIAPVTVINDQPEVQDTPARPATEGGSRFRWWAIAAGVVVVAVAAFVATSVFRVRERVQANSGPQIRSLAVLPFTNLSGDPSQEYFSDGMTDALITDLAQISSVKVISRTSIIRYKKTDKPTPDIARELNVDGIIEGTVQRSGDRVRITAQLIHAAADKHLWAKSYERDVRDLFLLEREVTDDIANQVRAKIATRAESSAQPRALEQNALDAYLEGEYHLYMAFEGGGRDEELRKAGQFFQQAIDAAPDFAPAYIGLADAHNTRFWGSNEDFNIMQASAEKALELDPNSSEAHRQMAEVKLADFDWAGAEEESRRAIGLNPNNALAHANLASSLSSLGRLEEAKKEGEIAQQLDPNQDHLSYCLYLLGEYDRAIEHLQRLIAARPDDAVSHWYLSQIYVRQGNYAESVRETGIAMTLSGLPGIAPRLEKAFATMGWKGAQRQWARELEQLMASRQAYFPAILSDVYMQLGERDKTLYWLEEGSKRPHMASSDPILQTVNVDPAFAPLHSDSRFKLLLQHMGLPE